MMIRWLADRDVRFPGNSVIDSSSFVIAVILFAIAIVLLRRSDRLAIAIREASKVATHKTAQPDNEIGIFNRQLLDRFHESRILSLQYSFFSFLKFGKIFPKFLLETLMKIRDNSLKFTSFSFSKHQELHRDRYNSESDLSRQDERLQLALDATVDGIWDWDFKHNYFFWSRGIYKILGFPNLENSCKGADFIFSRIHPEDQHSFLKTIKTAQTSISKLRIEVRIKRKNGQYGWFLCRGKFLCDRHGKPCRVVGSIVDITSYKETEKALKIKTELFRALFEQITLGVAFTKMDGTPILVNHQLCELLGYSESELMNLNFRDLLDSENWKPDYNSCQNATSNPPQVLATERCYTRPDGTTFWGVTVISTICDIPHLGNLNVILIRDISDRKQIEQIKDEFVSTVSHELRTPLTSIYASLTLLNSGLYKTCPEKKEKMLEVATRETSRLVRLVNDILDIEKLRSGKAELDQTVCNVADLIEESVNSLQPLAEQKQIAIVRHWLAASIWATPDAMIQILNNLLSNAIKFSASGSTITISVSLQDEAVLFQVQDRGCGIPADQLETIFQPFKQVKGLSHHPKGTGLGLAICQKLVQQHGGKIWVESRLGEGSTFIFTIPQSRVSDHFN
ncbi:MAG: PAS domain-containing sensor histidine kinase [Limnospira sp.]